MPSASISVRIDRTAVERMNMPTGMVHEWVVGLAQEVLEISVATAPVRSGELKAGLHRGTGSWSRSGVSVRVLSSANHTSWVHGGTYGPIFPREGRAMTLGSMNPRLLPPRRKGERVPRKGTANVHAARLVSGQRSQPFMSRALRLVMDRHAR